MSDDEENAADVKAFGLDDSGSDFSFGCYGINGDKYPMDEIDEWEEDEVTIFCYCLLQKLSYYDIVCAEVNNRVAVKLALDVSFSCSITSVQFD